MEYRKAEDKIIKFAPNREGLKPASAPDDEYLGSQHHSIHFNCHRSNSRSHELQYVFSIPQQVSKPRHLESDVEPFRALQLRPGRLPIFRPTSQMRRFTQEGEYTIKLGWKDVQRQYAEETLIDMRRRGQRGRILGAFGIR